ncbi:helix-turn-helix domain-containing protein [Oleiharenicola lentus]|uniref:helix-turn-helix domain-containing protein n=1 Tax=Oleiharenicola lentus TaxID=2508720 RepID=UPI003F66A183
MWREFIARAEKGDEPFSAVCAHFGVSRKTGYKWLNRFRVEGEAGLVEQSRRPKNSPRKTPDSVSDQVLALRRENPEWSAARISAELKDQGITPVPAPSTIDLILRRRREQAAQQATLFRAHPDALRFEPNYRWTLRFGRELKLSASAVLPVLVKDDTTHFIVAVSLLPVTRREDGLKIFLEQLFANQGLPWRLALPEPRVQSALTVWLMRLAIGVDFVVDESSGSEGDGQQLAAQLAKLPAYQRMALSRLAKTDLLLPLYGARGLTEKSALTLLEQLREKHNFGGSQEAMQQRSPISLYRPSARAWPEMLPEIISAPEADVRLVSEKGIFTFQRRLIHVGRAFAGFEVELKPTLVADHYVVLFAGQVLGQVDVSAAEVDETTSLSLHLA